MSQKTENENIVFRIITLGNSGVGKTSILRRYAYKMFNEDIMTTIGVNLVFKEITLKNGKTIKLKLIDTAGQEKYRALTKSYYKNADGVFFVFAWNDPDSFENIMNWIKEFNDNQDKSSKINIPKYFIGNKSDLNPKDKLVTEESVKKFIDECNIEHYENTSAKDNININKIVQEISELIYENYEKYCESKQKNITVGKFQNEKGNNCGKCYSSL